MEQEKEITDGEFDAVLREQFKLLPKVVQTAMLSADVEKHLRDLAQTHQLHVDQWNTLENVVQLTLMGIHPIDELQNNIKESLHLDDTAAQALTNAIYEGIFEPIRQELERELGNENAGAKVESNVDAMRTQVLSKESVRVVAATPPLDAHDTKATRAPISESYSAGQPSHERKTVADDPYREQTN